MPIDPEIAKARSEKSAAEEAMVEKAAAERTETVALAEKVEAERGASAEAAAEKL